MVYYHPIDHFNVAAPSSRLHSRSPNPLLRNVVVFGEPGAGKSSIVNMLAGETVFKVAADASWTTFEHQGCVIKFGDQPMNVYDTGGLKEAGRGKVSPRTAFQQLYQLLDSLGGINIVIFVTRFRISRNTIKNYRLIRSIFCEESVPMVVAITGREFQEDNDAWWQTNASAEYAKYNMSFNDYAVGTAHDSLSTDPSYKALRTRLQSAISAYGSLTRPQFVPAATLAELEREPIHRKFESAVARVFVRLLHFFGRPREELIPAYKEVLEINGMGRDQATESMNWVEEKVLPLA
jgi:GTPase Era involved in 16S rRNA processing